MTKSFIGTQVQQSTTFVVKPTILGIYPTHKVMRTRTSLEVVTTGKRILDLG
jgi:hypothetical protein